MLAQGLRELGLDPGPLAPRDADARVDLSLKRALVASAIEQGGLVCLPLLGRGLHRLAHEPTHDALASAGSGLDLLERWQRLERYIHSRHRCELLGYGDGWAQLRHVALSGASPPLPAEDLVVLGVLAALLEAIGLQDVVVRLGAVQAYPEPEPKGLARAAQGATTAHWNFRWTTAVLRPGVERPPPAWPAALGADKAWPELGVQVYGRLMSDLTRSASLPEVARDLRMSPRTLQRELGDAGLSFSRLRAEARCRAGAWRLLHTDVSVAEIGFLSGYADQPHFTRSLRRRVGMTPSAYREAFAVAADPRRTAGR